MAPFLDPTFRGGDGNVGIIRSPVRAITLPDDRHKAKNARGVPKREKETQDEEPSSDCWRNYRVIARGLDLLRIHGHIQRMQDAEDCSCFRVN